MTVPSDRSATSAGVATSWSDSNIDHSGSRSRELIGGEVVLDVRFGEGLGHRLAGSTRAASMACPTTLRSSRQRSLLDSAASRS